MPFPGHHWCAEARALSGVAASVTLTMSAQLALSAVETLLVARLGVAALAGVTLALSLHLLVFLFALGVVTAVTPLAAQARGRGDAAALRGLGQSGLLVGLLMSLPGAALLLAMALLPGLLPGDGPEAAAAGRYLLGAAWGLPGWVCYVALRSFAVATGRLRATTAIMLSVVPLHAASCWWLLRGGFGLPPLGPLGAGLAHALAGLLAWTLLILASRATSGAALGGILRRPFRPDAQCCREILRLGLPFACRILLREGVMPAAAFAVAPFGATALAAHAVAARITDLLGVLCFGFGDAANMRVGFAAGAGEAGQARHSARVAIQLALLSALLPAALLLSAPGWVAGWFLTGADPAAQALAASLLPLAAALLVGESLQSAAGGALSGLRDGRGPLLIAVAGSWGVALPLGTLLSWTGTAPVPFFWTGLVAGGALTAALSLLRLQQRLALLR
ncbi:MATE family efflux transporter [Roseomonas elaeocarpi]|uniref:MATE family efflux transporter n=1 Tax=Roseomonas elaeocarpi TaxID=907779 RepID=A0ABV6JPA9_9PROT